MSFSVFRGVRFCALPDFCRLFQNDAQKAYKKHTERIRWKSARRLEGGV